MNLADKRDKTTNVVRINRRRRIRLLLLAVLLTIAACAIVPFSESYKHQLERAVRHADCIVIGPREPMPGIPTTTIKGREEVVELLRRIEFEPAFEDGHCLCIGEAIVDFCRGETTLLTMTIHHGRALRIRNLPFWRRTDLPLTPASRALLADWLIAHGYGRLATTTPATP